MQSISRRSAMLLSLAVTIVILSAPTRAEAQSGSGGWGAEGRIGSSQSASLLRWFSPSWSLVINGSAGFSDNETEGPAPSSSEGNSHNFNASVLLRKEFGSRRVRPHIAFGPTFSVNRNETESGFSGNPTRNEQDITTLGGRFEFGGIASVTEHIGLGIIGSASALRTVQEGRSSQNNSKTESTTRSFSMGSPQFVMRVRF